MAPQSGRDNYLLRSLVPPLPLSLSACGRIDQGARASRRCQLRLAMGSDLRPWVREALPPSSQADRKELL